MKTPRASLKLASGLLTLAFFSLPLAGRGEEAAREKPAATKEKPADTPDPKVNADAKAKETNDDQAPPMSADEMKKTLKKYDVNGNGKLDEDELAKMKADREDNKADKRNAAAEDKVDRRSTQHINQSIRRATKQAHKIK